jgi:hypothetical protein
MVIVNPNFEYGPYGDHTFINLASPFAPSTQLTRMPEDGFVKLFDDQ